MADTVTTKHEPESDGANSPQHNSSSTSQKPSSVAHKPVSGAWLASLGGVAFVALLLLSFSFGRVVEQRSHEGAREVRFSMSGVNERAPAGTLPGYDMRGQRMHDRDDSESTTRVSGVVTNVSGNTITVAGNGTTAKVEVSDNTTYGGSDEPVAVNDSIVAIGATNSDGVLIASSVQLHRE